MFVLVNACTSTLLQGFSSALWSSAKRILIFYRPLLSLLPSELLEQASEH